MFFLTKNTYKCSYWVQKYTYFHVYFLTQYELICIFHPKNYLVLGDLLDRIVCIFEPKPFN